MGQRNIKARITYSECVCTLRCMRMQCAYTIKLYVTCPVVQYFSTLFYKIQENT